MWILVDKSGGGGLDDWEVKIADFVVLLGKDAKKGPGTSYEAGLSQVNVIALVEGFCRCKSDQHCGVK